MNLKETNTNCINIHEGVSGMPTHIRTGKKRISWSVWRLQPQPISHGMVSPYEGKQSHRSLSPPCVLINYQRK